MSTPDNPFSARATRVAVVLSLMWLNTTGWLEQRCQQAWASRDAGSETVEKAVIAAVVLGLAVGLTAAIAAVVNQYRGQLSP